MKKGFVKIIAGLLSVLMILTILMPLSVQAADAANYNAHSIDYADYYSDYHEEGYMNECSYVSISPSVSFVDDAGNEVATTTVGDTTYVPSGTKVKLAWGLGGESAFASKSLDIWQHAKDSGFSEVTSYNIGRSGPIGLRGRASGLVGSIIGVKKSGKWRQIYSIKDYNKINFLCASVQINGGEGDSAAVGACMANTTEYYYYDDKVKIAEDNTPPTVLATLSTTPTANGWYAPGTKATFSASDAESGVANLFVQGEPRTNPFTMDLASGINNIAYSATNKAGKGTGDKQLSASVDGTAPSVSAKPSKEATTSGWYQGDISVTFSASDGESGLKTFTVDGAAFTSGNSVNVQEGTKLYKYAATDNVDNKTGEKEISLRVDKTKPLVTITGGVSTWTNQDVELKISGSDGQSGLSSMIVEYSPDNITWIDYNTKRYDNSTTTKHETVLASKNGYYRVKAQDAVGYETISSSLITITQIDKESPTIVATVKGNEGAPVDNWYKGSAKIKIVATDLGVSGLKQLEYNGNVTTDAMVELPTTVEGLNPYTYEATDNAGNTSGEGKTDIYVDKTAPTDLAWSSNQTTWTNQDITVTMNAKDKYSGLKKFVVQKYNEATTTWDDYTEVKAAYETVLTTRKAAIKENGTYRFKAVDRVGYEKIVDNNIIIEKIDKEKPIIIPSEIGTISDNGWYKDKVKLILKVKEYGVSGLKNIYIKLGNTTTNKGFDTAQIFLYNHNELIEDEGITNVDYNALDYAGNYSDNGQSILKVDKSKPTNVTASADTDTWSNTSVALSAAALDNMSGLSKIIVQKYAAGAWTDYRSQTYSGEATIQTTNFAIEENGIYRVKAIDKVGYDMTSDVSMGGSEIVTPNPDIPTPGVIIIKKIDKTKPTIEAEIINAEKYIEKSNGWYREDVVLKLKAEDEASGVSSITCNADVSENTSKLKTFENHYNPFQAGVNIFNYIANDVAGNQSEEGTTVLNIDSVSPINLTVEKITKGWVNQATGVTIKCKGQDNESGLLMFILEKSVDGVNDWTNGTTYDYLGETTLQEVNMIVKENGYYRLAVYDRVLHKSVTTDVIYVYNIDKTDPEGASLTISPDTTEWVNEPTGVDLIATGQDMDSGVDELSVMQKSSVKAEYEAIFTEVFNGETTLLDTEYLTHINGFYKTQATDAVGNYNAMPDEDALEVPNIDPVNPMLTVKADVLMWASADNGYPIYAFAKDLESGLKSIKLQSYDEDTGIWSDTDTSYTVEDYVKGEETLSTYEGNIFQNIMNTVKLSFNKAFFTHKTVQEAQFKENGTNEMIKAVFKVYKNGTYRVVIADIVANATSSQAVVVTTMDFDKPALMVEGNPTEWTNQTATIKVTAKDADSKISKMTLNGKEVEFKEKDKAFFFSFVVEKNADYVVAAYDQAGNSMSEEVKVTKIDKENPYLTSSISRWKEGSAATLVELYDDLSGIKSAYMNEVLIHIPYEKHTSYSKDIRAEVSYYVTITDKAGNKVVQSISDNKALTRIKVTTPPDKTKYQTKEKFDKKGMVVTAYYTDGSNQVVKDYVILNGNGMAVNQNNIEVEYTERGITKDDDTPVTVETTSTQPSQPTIPQVPVTPVLPVNPVIPIKPVVPNIEQEEPVIEVVETELSKIEKNKVPAVEDELPRVVKENDKTNSLPFIIGGATVGAGLLFLFFFILFTNVKVYSMNEKGDFKLIGRTRARIKGDEIFVKTNTLLIILATSGDFKFVFTKSYAKIHGDSDVLIRIEKCEFEKYLPEGEDTIYVEYEG